MFWLFVIGTALAQEPTYKDLVAQRNAKKVAEANAALAGDAALAGLFNESCEGLALDGFTLPVEARKGRWSSGEAYVGNGWEAHCEQDGGREEVHYLYISRRYAGPLPYGLSWDMSWRSARKHLEDHPWAVYAEKHKDDGSKVYPAQGGDQLILAGGQDAKMLLVYDGGKLTSISLYELPLTSPPGPPIAP